MTATPAVRLLLVDADPGVLEALADLFEGEADLRVVGRAHTVPEALTAVECCRPDVVLVDLSMIRDHGPAVVRALRHRIPEPAVVVLSAVEDDLVRSAVRGAGATGWIAKETSRSGILDEVRRIGRRR